nr:ORF1 [Torque teno felis virus]
MAPYRRWRPWRRRRGRWRWKRGPYRRIRKPRRRKKRWTARRVRALFRRKKKRVTLWDPDSKAKCIINGFTWGLIAQSVNITNRMWTTVFTPTEVLTWIAGGGVNLKTFSLKFLYQEHMFFRNCWSRSNDGFDLAQYLGTKIYLKPHKNQDYIFWWDTDLTTFNQQDYLRLHPAKALCAKNVVFVRSQVGGGNHKTHKIFIKPPANITSQWKFQSEWYDFPLFAWGMTLINWYEPFFRQTSGFIPYTRFPQDNTYIYQPGGGHSWQSLKTVNLDLYYSPLVDNGQGNIISVTYIPPNQSFPSSSDDFKNAGFTDGLPYWYSCFGQNTSWDFGIPKDKNQVNYIPWVSFTWRKWTQNNIEVPPAAKPGACRLAFMANNARIFAASGWFVQSSTPERINIPLLYKSYWRWGGTMLTKQPITALIPNTNQISVKNPATVGESVIRPGDVRNGLLTATALRRFLQPSKFSDERRPEPFEEQPPRYASEEEYDETGSEAEESEEECDEKSNVTEIIRCLSRRVQRERTQRRSLHKFFKSLLKPTM